MLLDEVRVYCLKHSLLEPGLVVVAVSGGADSLTLLHLLLRLRDEFDIRLHAATFDHSIRGAAGAQDVQFVREIAERWGVAVTAGLADVPKLAGEWRMGLEEAARKARYTFLMDVAAQLNASAVATGHNQDDQAETVLLHIIRGSGLAGLRGMRPNSPLTETISLIRPLLATPRVTIDAYLHDLDIVPRTDITNADTQYSRNRLRHEILPLLAEINPQVRSVLAHSADTLRDDYVALVSALPPLARSSLGFAIDRLAFLRLPIALQRLWIRESAHQLEPEAMLSMERAEAALELAKESPRGLVKIPLGGRLWFSVRGEQVVVTNSPNAQRPYPDGCPSLETGSIVLINAVGLHSLPGTEWILNVEQRETVPERNADPLSITLAVENGMHVALRTRRHGDHFKPLGLSGHSQKLKETLINLKIPVEWRDRVPVLTINGEIAWFVAPKQKGPVSRVSQTFARVSAERRAVWRFTFVRPNTDLSTV